jgi:hypothetical protein
MGIRIRKDIGRKLLLAVEQARIHHEALQRESALALEIVRDVGIDNNDGRLSLERSIVRQHALQAAMEAYKDALHRFSEFVLHSKAPE